MKLYHKEGCGICNVAIKKMSQKNINYEKILVNPDDPLDENFRYLVSLNISSFPVLELDNGAILKGNEVPRWVNNYEVTNGND